MNRTISQQRALKWAQQRAGLTGQKTRGPALVRYPVRHGWMLRIRAAMLLAASLAASLAVGKGA